MAHCSQCGQEMTEGVRYCPKCGAATDSVEPPSQTPPADDPAQSNAGTGGYFIPGTTQIPKDIRNMAMFCHLATFAGFIGVPFGNILGPLLVWLLKREASPFIDDHGKEALNFQISVTIYGIVSAILILVIIGFVLLPALLVFDIIVVIMAAVRANGGRFHRYPLTIRFIK